MAYDDTKWGGFAKIIVDTSTMTVGDTVRVKSVTTGTNYDKQVVTVGTPLIWETDIYKDYVKICMVQTINDTPTEIGGVYKTVDYGQTLFVNVLDKSTLQGIQGILNSHTENYALNIGDEVTIKINDGGTPKDWVMQIAKIDSSNHQIDFVSKNVWINSVGNTSQVTQYPPTTLRTNVISFYNIIDEKDRAFIKEVTRNTKNSSGTDIQYNDKIWIPSQSEAIGDLPLFLTQANRIRKDSNNTAVAWWTSKAFSTNNTGFNPILADGNYTGFTWADYSYNKSHAILPCFSLVADS